MKAEKQRKEATSRTSQTKQGNDRFGFVDNRPEAIAQAKLINDIQSSDKNQQMSIQQKRENKTRLPNDLDGLVSLKSNAIQRASVVQRMLLDGLHIGEAYENTNEDNIIAHMGGEWNGGNAGAVGGGHLLAKIEEDWGHSFANSVPVPGHNVADGVHFSGIIPTVNRVTQNQFTFRLVKTIGNQRVSQPKTSTFWPTNWNQQNLRDTLRSSWSLGRGGNFYASKKNTSYWYAWQSLGDNTLFPNRILEVTNSDRQRMRRGRIRM